MFSVSPLNTFFKIVTFFTFIFAVIVHFLTVGMPNIINFIYGVYIAVIVVFSDRVCLICGELATP